MVRVVVFWKIKKWILNAASSFANFEIQVIIIKMNLDLINGVYSRDNLPKIKDGAYVINLDEYSDIGTHWVSLYVGGVSPYEIMMLLIFILLE